MFFDLSTRKIDSKEMGSLRVVQKLAMWLLNRSCLVKNLFGGFQYFNRETSNKAKNLILYLNNVLYEVIYYVSRKAKILTDQFSMALSRGSRSVAHKKRLIVSRTEYKTCFSDTYF
jgi:hypothetical protein